MKTNHIGISVSSLQRSISFYVRGLGMEVVRQGRFEGERFETILGLRGARGNAAMLRSDSVRLELFEFEHPTPQPARTDRPVCDHGITHFCIEVDDIETAYKRLLDAGATFHCPPLLFSGVTLATYGRDPDGNVFELLQERPETDEK